MYAELKNEGGTTTTGAARRRRIFEPANIALILTVILIIGLVIYGDTLIKIPRYYAIEIFNDGKKEWVYMEEGYAGEDDRKGEENAYWEPPCVAEEEDVDDAISEEKGIVFNSFLPTTESSDIALSDTDFRPVVPPLQAVEE